MLQLAAQNGGTCSPEVELRTRRLPGSCVHLLRRGPKEKNKRAAAHADTEERDHAREPAQWCMLRERHQKAEAGQCCELANTLQKEVEANHNKDAQRHDWVQAGPPGDMPYPGVELEAKVTAAKMLYSGCTRSGAQILNGSGNAVILPRYSQYDPRPNSNRAR